MNNSQTKEKRANYMREYRKKNPDVMKRIDLKKRFRISLEEFELLQQKQNYVCAICLKPERSVDRRTQQTRHLAVDHCHTTGKIRGLLCSDCNLALGLVKDDQETLTKMLNYIKQNSTVSA